MRRGEAGSAMSTGSWSRQPSGVVCPRTTWLLRVMSKRCFCMRSGYEEAAVVYCDIIGTQSPRYVQPSVTDFVGFISSGGSCGRGVSWSDPRGSTPSRWQHPGQRGGEPTARRGWRPWHAGESAAPACPLVSEKRYHANNEHLNRWTGEKKPSVDDSLR